MKRKALVFIDYDLLIRHFIMNGTFKELERSYEVTYVFHHDSTSEKQGIYAELAGMGMSADAYHVTAPSIVGPRRAMLAALRNAGANPDDVNYINAHGTSTPLGDASETAAIKAALGDHAYRVAVNSTKSMHGHLLGASGALEAAITALAIHHQISPPTINLVTPDPACDLDYVAGSARELKIDIALSNSFGFGGSNIALAFRKNS